MIVVEKSNRQKIYGLSSEQTAKLRDALTFNNPKYVSAKRYSRSKYISISPFISFYTKKKEYIEVPIGFDVSSVLSSKFDVIDNRNDVTVDYPEFKFTLRADQEIAKESYLKEQKNEFPKSLIHLPTGKGKSLLALNIAFTLKQRTLILVHKTDLIVGWKKEIEDCFDNKAGQGLIQGKNRTIGKHFTIATVQTLSRMSAEELEGFIDKFGLVVQDECHHIGLNIFNTIDQFNSKYKLGLSATPKRSDGLSFTFDLFLGGLAYKHIYTQEDEDIMAVKVNKIDTKVKFRPFLYDKMIYNYFDFNEDELPDEIQFIDELPYEERPRIPYADVDNEVVLNTMYKIQVCKDVIGHYRKGHSCIVLFQFKEQLRVYYNYLRRYVPKDSILLYYGDSKEDSGDMMKKAENRECLITLATLAKATEGTNVKSWEVEFLVSSINNEKNVEQVVGRIRRTKKGKINPTQLYDYRCPNVSSFNSHAKTRDRTYKKLKLIVDEAPLVKKSRFTRGYQR